MLRCGCGLMIECEVKTCQTVESIEHTRREGGQFIITQASKRRLKEGGLWKEWKEQIGKTVESIEHIRREGGEGVGMKLNEKGNRLMKGEMNIIEKGD